MFFPIISFLIKILLFSLINQTFFIFVKDENIIIFINSKYFSFYIIEYSSLHIITYWSFYIAEYCSWSFIEYLFMINFGFQSNKFGVKCTNKTINFSPKFHSFLICKSILEPGFVELRHLRILRSLVIVFTYFFFRIISEPFVCFVSFEEWFS